MKTCISKFEFNKFEQTISASVQQFDRERFKDAYLLSSSIFFINSAIPVCFYILYTEHVKEPDNSVEKSREVVPGSLCPNSILGLSLPRPVNREFNKLYEFPFQSTLNKYV